MIGVISLLGSSIACECIAISGVDFVFIDCEHGPFSEELTQEMVRAAQMRGCKAFVRTKDSSRASLMRMLDIGADALIIPDVHSACEAKKIVEYCKYYPLGRRGVGFSRSNAYGTDEGFSDLGSYFAKTNREKWIIPQCETSGALREIREIASIPGVDGVFVGPYDLSVALGAPAKLDTEEFQRGIENILKACKENGKRSMIFAPSKSKAKDYFNLGFDDVAIGTDASFLMERCKDIISRE